MAIDWNKDRISRLTNIELSNLLVNAKRLNNDQLVADCEAEIIARKPVRKPSFNAPEGFVPVVRTALSKKLEQDAVEMIVDLANELKKIYDFGTDKARSLSADTKHFMPHRLLDSKGSAKVGGAQKQGRVAFDRYISYRLKDEIYALLAILFDSEDQRSVKYQVFGPPRLLENFAPLAEVRPYLMDDEVIGKSSGGEEFDNFKEAADRFRWLIEQVAPKLKS